jgi:hypothetical protein
MRLLVSLLFSFALLFAPPQHPEDEFDDEEFAFFVLLQLVLLLVILLLLLLLQSPFWLSLLSFLLLLTSLLLLLNTPGLFKVALAADEEVLFSFSFFSSSRGGADPVSSSMSNDWVGLSVSSFDGRC